MKKYTISLIDIIKNTEVPKEFFLSKPDKISLHPNCAFNLPAGPEFSCPGATEACKDCYAQKGHHVFYNVKNVMAKNWVLINNFEQSQNESGATNLLLNKIKPSATVFRIFESGDFSSQFQINVWTNVIRNRKQTLFWAYTRSFNFNYSKIVRQKNFTLWASTDSYNEKQAKCFIKRYASSNIKHAYGPYEHGKQLPNKSFICPVTNHKIKISGACERCKLCVVKGRTLKHVVFLKH